ncbi:MAG: hypothetical protein LBP95_04265 [Deltaproteobacteria bacterium]|nr:hypothetical protein [Deltaproteobacteria bacterium]
MDTEDSPRFSESENVNRGAGRRPYYHIREFHYHAANVGGLPFPEFPPHARQPRGPLKDALEETITALITQETATMTKKMKKKKSKLSKTTETKKFKVNHL